MKAITIRNVDPVISSKLKIEAQKQGKRVNQYLIDMIKQNLGLQKKAKYTKVYNDMDHLFGKWSKEEFEQIQGKIAYSGKKYPLIPLIGIQSNR